MEPNIPEQVTELSAFARVGVPNNK